MIAVAGKQNKPVPLDRHGLYKASCAELAEALGWQASALFAYWKDFALMHEFESGWPRPLCEWQALRDLYACFAKQGAQDFS